MNDNLSFDFLEKKKKNSFGTFSFVSFSFVFIHIIENAFLSLIHIILNRINLYSIASEDIKEREPSMSELKEEQSTDCDDIQTDSQQTSEATQSTANQSEALDENTNMPKDKAQSADASVAFINFSIDESSQMSSSDANADQNIVDGKKDESISLNKTTSAQCDDLMNFTMSGESTVGAIKSQPSDCSVITLSSEESQLPSTQEAPNKSIGHVDDEDLFEKSIRSPPMELQDDLFENDSVDNDENVPVNTSLQVADGSDGKIFHFIYSNIAKFFFYLNVKL